MPFFAPCQHRKSIHCISFTNSQAPGFRHRCWWWSILSYSTRQKRNELIDYNVFDELTQQQGSLRECSVVFPGQVSRVRSVCVHRTAYCQIKLAMIRTCRPNMVSRGTNAGGGLVWSGVFQFFPQVMVPFTLLHLSRNAGRATTLPLF